VVARALASLRAAILGRYPSSSTAASTAARVAWPTLPVPLMTLDTVIADTPARSPTARIVTPSGLRIVIEGKPVTGFSVIDQPPPRWPGPSDRACLQPLHRMIDRAGGQRHE